MILEAIVDDQVFSLNVPESLLSQASEFFDQLDRDMDQGWQMSRDWVAAPDQVQRGQIVADKLLTALENENEKLGMLTAGYLLARLPGLKSVELDIQGEIQNNQFSFHPAADSNTATTPPQSASSQTPPMQDTGEDPQSPNGQAAEQLKATAQDCSSAPRGLSKLNAMAQAGQDVTKVFKVGKGYRFSVFDHSAQSWQDGPLLKTQEEADRLREQVFTSRYEALQRAD
ncbi:hypothetical protein [Thiorhodovibrio frisius]|uniref:Uncharacterized protein n=1 Tax=Thiorhodovibrio frisius TaxID=631362 RepID=H8YWM8_9GAMM|nr:hypothetical protein [Thiorhodovibrio frisius]EIC22854.1 hypothetical protein Thi970DRAFT_00490 [Thiorhodovibrio frisius]WPL22889.1 hypothetical protein Thiofri_03067 [Thiorhodovibrio frisius]